jgi:hypothetical protein
MALGVSALAGPRGADRAAPGTGKGSTEVTRLVTGDPAQIDAVVVAGVGATAVIAFNPVNPPTGLPSYPAGVTINGNELTIDRTNKDGFRAWFNLQVSNWDPAGDGPNLATYQAKIDCAGYYQSDCLDLVVNPGDGLDLVPAVVPCPGDDPTPCQVAFGEAWAACNGLGDGNCDPGYLDPASGRPDSWCAASGGGCASFGVAIGTCNYNYFAVSNSIPGHQDQSNTCVGGARNGQGCRPANAAANCGGAALCTGPKLPNYYGGTLVLDLPAGAKGKYTIALNPDETFVAQPGTPPERLESLAETGFVVNFVTGSCCHLLGTPGASCEDTCLNRSDCTALGAPSVFTPGGSCDVDGTPAGCSECTTPGVDPLCNDNDACTTETCTLIGSPAVGVCTRGFKAGYNPVKGGPGDTGNCCDKASGTLTLKDDGDVCTADSCSSPLDNRGSAVHSPAGASGVACDDGNSCSFGDACDGVNSEAAGGCVGTGVIGQACATDTDCQHGGQTPTATCSGGVCDCSVVPKLTFVLDGGAKTCSGGFTPGAACAKDSDCPGGGVCDLFPANCFDGGEKISAAVHIGSAAEPINGGQFMIEFDPSCVTLNSVACAGPYNIIYGPVETASSVFIACGVDPFAGVNGPLGNVDIVALSYTMIGECNNCELCFCDDGPPGGPPGPCNPQNTYLVDADGYKVNVETQCKEIAENGELVLNVPDNVKTNSDCDIPAAVVTWDAPSASFSCGDVSVTCRGAHESGLALSPAVVMGGGLLPQGASSFCCFAQAEDKCEQTAGCAGDTNACAGTGGKPDGCWTVQINDETGLDIHIQLEPPLVADEITRCIEFCLYGNCLEEPYCFEEDVLFGGLYNFIGKANGSIKVPKGKWGCITAQDQLHSLRSCDIPDCIDGQLSARFKGDPTYGGNWLIMGNLDAYKKSLPDEDPSLDVIDILDFGKFVASYGVCYEDRTYGCHEGTHGDIDGDGCVGMSDYNFVVRNFLVSSKDCCCGPSAADLPPALTEVSIEELRQMGQADLIVADLNGDGVLNADDMEAFTQGVRPVKTIRKGGKGLRSGR